MGLNDTPSGERIRIGFFGTRNAGKSSLVNAVTGQDLAVVSDVPGTTTDLVNKTMELLPLGPVVIVDTPGLDDEGALGELRVGKARREFVRCDLAVVVVDATRGLQDFDREIIDELSRRSVPTATVWSKADLLSDAERAARSSELGSTEILVSSVTGEGVFELKELLGKLAEKKAEKRLISDLVEPGDVCILVVPIDASAPKGRIILPQQMVLRDLLDSHAMGLVCQVEELADTLKALNTPPKLVITDSQAFAEVAAIVPEDVPMTSFSIVMARYKGELEPFVRGAEALSSLKDGDRVLIAEGCTHHRQCEDIGTVKMPRWVRAFSGAEPTFEFTSGAGYPDNLSDYDLVLHCGACMLNAKELQHRMALAEEAGVPIVNYGIGIACMNGILDRALRPLPEMDY